MYDIVIHNGRIVSTAGVSDTSNWIGIIGEKIVSVASGAVPFDECIRAIDAMGALVTPGGELCAQGLEQGLKR